MAKRLPAREPQSDVDEREKPFTRLAAHAATLVDGLEPTEEEIVKSVQRTREALHRERYGAS
ncbi:MAG: hypothetical protein AB7I38_19555 [Dehalococcoidia bacterium]